MRIASTMRALGAVAAPILVALGCSSGGTGSVGSSAYDFCAAAFYEPAGSACVACLRSTCPAGLDALESGCSTALECMCPGGGYYAGAGSGLACSQQLGTPSCVSATTMATQGVCAGCDAACGRSGSGTGGSGTSSSGMGGSSGSGSTSSSGGGGTSGSGSGGSGGLDAGSGGTRAWRCADNGSNCLCYDPAPSDYTLVTCPAYACCWADLTYPAELDCECLNESAPCVNPNPNSNAVQVAHCPP